MQNLLRVVVATLAISSGSLCRGQSATSFVDYRGGTYTQNFDSLPNPGAVSVNTSGTPVINGVTYTLPINDGIPFAFDDSTIGSGGRSLGGTAMSGWYGASALAAKFGATDGDQTTGGALSFGLASSSNRALGLIATSTTGATYVGVAIKNNTGAPISSVNVSFVGELWKQGTAAKTFVYGYTVDNAGALNLISAATATTAVALGHLSAPPTVVAAVDGTQSVNQTPVALTNIVLATPLQSGGVLWITAAIADATGSGQGYGIDNFNFSAVASAPGAPLITAQPVSQSINAGAGTVLSVSATGTGLTYQWQLDGVNVPGATNPSLILTGTGTNQGGHYTVVITSATGVSVTSNAAVLAVNSNARPVNISARGVVGTGVNILIAGFVISGTTSETVLIRAVGPTLAGFGVDGALGSPQLTLYNAKNSVIASNSGWAGNPTIAATSTKVGAFPLGAASADSALVVTLAPGNYTAQVSGANGATGVGLLEVYDVPSD